MISLSSILAPAVESARGEGEERPAKRRKSLSPQTTRPSPSSEVSNSTKKDEKKARWLAGLSHEELLGVAQGAVWQVGGIHSKNCFTCKKPGTSLDCHNCPRSYHRRCLDPPIHGNFKIDGPWYCPNCVILRDDLDDGGSMVVNGVVSHHKARQGMMKVDVDVDSVTPWHRERAKEKSPETERAGWGLVARGGRKEPLLLDGLHIGGERQLSHHKRSRYTTLSGDIDDALGLLNRELEQAAQRRLIISEMAEKLAAAEQEARIWKGRAELLESDRKTSDGKALADQIEILRGENWALKRDLESLKADVGRKEQEWDEWRREMKAFVDGK